MHDTRRYNHSGYVSPKKKMAEQKRQITKNIVADRLKYANR